MRDLQLGDTICDMHYGLNLDSLGIDSNGNRYASLRSSIAIDSASGSDFIESTINQQLGSDSFVYSNKLLVVIGELRYPSEPGFIAAYSYDARRFGIMEIVFNY